MQILAKAKTSYLYLEMTVATIRPSTGQALPILFVRYGAHPICIPERCVVVNNLSVLYVKATG
jgi:hypothetical protein